MDFKEAICQNESETTEAIEEARTLCTCTIREAKVHQAKFISETEAWHATCIKGAEANYTSTIAEVENCSSVAIRKAESHSPKQAHSIQQSHAEGMQHLEMEVIEQEGIDCFSSLAACGAALWANP